MVYIIMLIMTFTVSDFIRVVFVVFKYRCFAYSGSVWVEGRAAISKRTTLGVTGSN
jgi:hypothetical protein